MPQNEEQQEEFRKLTAELWGEEGNPIVDRKVGNGRVLRGQSLPTILNQLGIKPDVAISSHSGDAPIRYIHRRYDNTHYYFLANERRSHESLFCTFRVGAMQPELWNPVSGTTTLSPIYKIENNCVSLPVQLPPYGSVFIVFRLPASVNKITSLKRDGVRVIATKPFASIVRKLYTDVANNFTITLWAKPEMSILLAPSLHMEKVKATYTDYYAIYPSSGQQLYGEGHATCGLAIGRNGIAVWEHGLSHPQLVLSLPAPLSGWSHIALVYNGGVPSVYLNGLFIGEGKSSGTQVHPGLGSAYRSEGATYYNGDMSAPQLHTTILSPAQIRTAANTSIPEAEQPPFVVEPFAAKKPALLFWQNGNYEIQKGSGALTHIAVANLSKPVVLKGPWTIYFPHGFGAPQSIEMNVLQSLHKHPDKGVKYFSGTATYTHSFMLPSGTNVNVSKRLFIDLGRVEVVASVWINGRFAGSLWTRPFKADITHFVKEGKNNVEIKVTNLWPNRLIGDEQKPSPYRFEKETEAGSFERLVGGGIQQLPDWYLEGKPKPADGRIAFTTWKHYTKDSPLLESGLIGPVVLQMAAVKEF